MKKFLMLFAMVMMGFFAMAQNQISYQAVVRDANNRLVTTGTVDVTVAILNSADAVQYTEGPVTVTPNANGLISMMIGGGTGWNAINWEGAKIKTTVNINGSDVVNTVPVTAVPYSLISKTVDPAVLEPYATKDTLKNFVTKATFTVDSANFMKSIADSAVAVRGALVDTAAHLRTAINTNANNIATNKQAIIDTASHLRTAININADNIAANKQAIIDTASHLRTAINTNANNIATNKQAIIDTANNLRNAINANNQALKDTAANLRTAINANKQAIIDTANNLRVKIETNAVNIATNVTNIAANKQAIIDTANNLRNAINANKQAIIDTAANIRAEIDGAGFAKLTKVQADSAFLHNLIKDTLSNYYLKSETFTKDETRSEIHDTANVLRKEMKHTHAELVDSVKNFISQTNVTEMYGMLGALEDNATIWQTWQDTLAGLVATYIRDAFKSSSEEHLVSLLKAHAASLTTTELENYETHLKDIYQSVNPTFRATVKDSLVKRVISELKNNASVKAKAKDLIISYLSDPVFKNQLLNALDIESYIEDNASTIFSNTTVKNAIKNTLPTTISLTGDWDNNPSTPDTSKSFSISW